ncbi:MAG: hypothetical protein ACI9LM_002476 [Alteromonadaceae bacterium]|jgi:hypothetical protein
MTMKTYYALFVSLLFITNIQAKNTTIEIKHEYSIDGYAQVKVLNNIKEEQACYVAIDGYKSKFRLPALKASRWHKATSKHYDHTNFSVWCDLLAFYPQYKKYKY